MAGPASTEVARLLGQLGPGGDPSARGEASARMLELLYGELRRIAGRLMKDERPGHTLQPTALVHEAWLKLAGDPDARFSDRAHFLGVAAWAMRQILVDRARRRGAARRGGGLASVTLGEEIVGGPDREVEVMELHLALERLASIDGRASKVAEMRLFAGMTVREVAHVLDVSSRTVDEDWAMARAWLRREVQGGATR
jgi:RNA polymerase sigma factor (TIGR02999 family)